ncbi:uncharacterized protein LOC129270924 [Lytechinus pictus]|uniref:uncharacterized protein LOC129270924 n=1 Tax=Lytechinus pictus TaxID=7653 RepID=UPI0030BA0530
MRKCMAGNRAVCQDCPLTNQLRGSEACAGLLTNQMRGMPLSEARNADQLVVGGGASSHSVVRRRKATMVDQCPGFWTYLGLTFALMTFISCQPVIGIDADIFPESGVIEVGTDLNITCVLRNETRADGEILTSNNFTWYKDQELIPSENYHTVNDTTSLLAIVNGSLEDTATYHCALPSDAGDVGEARSSFVQVGYYPQPAKSLTCFSHNSKDFQCEWEPVPTHIADETHVFQYYYRREYMECPELISPTKCFVAYEHHTGSSQEIRVRSSNALFPDGVYSSVRFNPDTETIPLPPRNLSLTSRSATVLHASWELPATWDPDFKFMLEYRLHWAVESDPQNWLGELRVPTGSSYDIHQLEPYTNYFVEVAGRHKYNFDQEWSDWTNPEQCRTEESAPVGVVQNVQTIDSNGTNDYERNVFISWESVEEGKANGLILGYFIKIIPHPLHCVEQQIFSDTLNDTQIIVEGLEKFCSYTVEIIAFNVIGPGPVKQKDIPDVTTNPLPPSVVTAETLSYQSVLVSWDEPKPAKGYINNYTVSWIQSRGQDTGQSRDVPASSLSFVIDGLEGYTLYSFKVSVTNKIGVSGWSTDVQAKTEEYVPEASPTNVTVEPIIDNPTGLQVNWIDVPEEVAHGHIRGHHLYYCHVAEDSLSDPSCQLKCLDKQERQTFLETVPKPVTLSGLDPFSHYLIWVSAYTNVGEGPTTGCPSTGRTSEGTPNEPVNVTIIGSNATSIGLTWSPPLEQNGIIRNYSILVKSNSTSDQQEFFSGGVQTFFVEGLYGYVHYSLQVRACTTKCGAPSDEVYQKTKIGVPQQPGSLMVQPLSHNKVQLSWEPPAHPNGPIDHYLVSYHHVEPSTPSPNVHRRSAPLITTTLANSINHWHKTTDLTIDMEVDCNQAPFLFQVLAVNVIDGPTLVGEAAEFELSECIALETTLSPLIWLILPGGAILLFSLLTSLYYVQSKLGKSWPDPVYTDMVKNKKDIQSFPRPKTAEGEDFDTIHTSCPSDLDVVVVAEEYPSQPYQCPIQRSLTDQLTDSLDIKGGGGKEAYSRTLSTDSGVPPSPQDHMDFSSSDDVFHADDYDGVIQDTYSFSNPKVIICQTGLGPKGGHFPRRSMSLSSCDGGLPAIEEDKHLNPILEKLPGKETAVIGEASGTTLKGWSDADEEEEATDYMRISMLSSPLKKPQVQVEDKSLPLSHNKLDGTAEAPMDCKIERVGSDSGYRSMASDSGYVRNDMAYMTFGVNKVTLETSFKSTPDDDYVPGPINYSVLAISQAGQQHDHSLEQSLTSDHVSEENLSYSKLGMASNNVGKGSDTLPLGGQLSSPPGDQKDIIGYVKLGENSTDDKHHNDAGTDVGLQSTWTDFTSPAPSSFLSDYVKGVDLHKVLQNTGELSKSSVLPEPPNSNLGGLSKDLPEITLEETKAKQKRRAVRSRTDSSSSSSGYGSDHKGQVSGYVVVSTLPEKQSDNYANLAFTSSESDTDSDDVATKSPKSTHLRDGHKLDSPSQSLGEDEESGECDKSFVEYIRNDSFGIGFVNDYPSHSKGNDNLGFTGCRTTPSSSSKGQHSCLPGHQSRSSKDIPGYVSHSAVLGEEAKGISTRAEGLSTAKTCDIYQIPNRESRKLESTGAELVDGDDEYVQFGGDSGYVLQVFDENRTKEEYMPMSPISKSQCGIQEDCL